MARPLALHVSALSNAEYQAFSSALHEIVGSEKVQDNTISVRETRGWLRGRYPDMQLTTIDTILKYFSPALAPADVLSVAQFYAAMRLVTHARTGASPEQDVVFVQSSPSSVMIPSPPKNSVPLPPPRLSPAESRTLRHSASGTAATSPPSNTNPFKSENLHLSATHPSLTRSHSSRSPPQPPPSSLKPNPFRSNSTLLTSSTAVPQFQDPSPRKNIPPLPPRKPASLVPPPQHISLVNAPLSNANMSGPSSIRSGQATMAPLPPPLTSNTTSNGIRSTTAISTSPLMKQSLQASRIGSSLRRAEASLERERVFDVLKSSSPSPLPATSITRNDSGSNSSEGGRSVSTNTGTTAPPIPNRRRGTQGPAMSLSSLERVAITQIPDRPPSPPSKAFILIRSTSPEGPPGAQSRSSSPGRSPFGRSPAPPTHPERKLSETHLSSVSGNLHPSFVDEPSPTSRVFRSKSLHHPPNPTGPPPPPRRKRPESIQLTSLSSSSPFFDPAEGEASSVSAHPQGTTERSGLGRHLSMSAAPGQREFDLSSVRQGLERTFRESVQPSLERARYKAEAGLTKRGYVSQKTIGHHLGTTGAGGHHDIGRGIFRPDRDGWSQEGLIGDMDDGMGAYASTDSGLELEVDEDDEEPRVDDSDSDSQPVVDRPIERLSVDEIRKRVESGWKTLA